MNLDPAAFLADPVLIQALEKQSTSIRCGGDYILFRQGELPAGLYIIDQGEATLTMNAPSGEDVLSIKATSGSVLGLPGLIGNEVYSLTATAHKDAQVSYVTRSDFAALMQSNPSLSIKVLQVLAAEVRAAREALLHAEV